MKLYNKRITRKFEDKSKRASISTRDAIVWSVDAANFYCTVKIQNSNTEVKAHYPRNWVKIPDWLKIGNAVRVRHKSGIQGFIEVVGHGRSIPSPVGEGDPSPVMDVLADRIDSGMKLRAYATGGMNVYVSSGQYRIAGVPYAYTETAIVLDAAPASGYGRYDSFFIGADGTIVYVAGSAAGNATEPVEPSTPSNHLKLGTIYVRGAVTTIVQSDIGVRWTARYAADIAYGGSMWTGNGWELGPLLLGVVAVGNMGFTPVDQHGLYFDCDSTAHLTMLRGDGLIGIYGGGWSSGPVSRSTSSYIRFYLFREEGDDPPLFKLTIDGYGNLTRLFVISFI